MKIDFDEQETVITFDAKKGEWTFYTCVPAHIRLFTAKMTDISGELEVLTENDGIPTSITFTVPKTSVNPKNFIKKKRAASKSQMENLKKANEKRL